MALSRVAPLAALGLTALTLAVGPVRAAEGVARAPRELVFTIDTTRAGGTPEATAAWREGRAVSQRTERRFSATLANAREAWRLFARATASDTAFGAAWYEQAKLWTLLSYPAPDRFTNAEVRARCLEAARRAVRLAPENADHAAVLGALLWNYERDWDGATRAFERAAALAPANSVALAGYAEMLAARGRADEAAAALARAEKAAPNFRTDFVHGELALWSGDAAKAEEWFRRALSRQENAVARQMLGTAIVLQRRPADALPNFEHAANLDERGGNSLLLWAYGLASAGRADEARRLIAEADTCCSGAKRSPFRLAAARLALGERDAAIAALERDFDEGGAGVARLGVDPLLAPLRGEPRVQALLRRLGLAR